MSDDVSFKELLLSQHDNAVNSPTVRPRRGRPPKSLVESKKKRNKVGRPLGDA